MVLNKTQQFRRKKKYSCSDSNNADPQTTNRPSQFSEEYDQGLVSI
jgi:hypothetical protein